MNQLARILTAVFLLLVIPVALLAQGTVKVGLNYPKTGPYAAEGLDQWRAAELAAEEINAAGGILGKPVEIVWRDSQSKPEVTVVNVSEMIDKDGVKMVFGGSSSGVAVAAGKVCDEKKIPFFATLSYSTATTGTEGRWTTFRECYDSWMAAKILGANLKKNFPGKKYLYITADYTWGWTTEASLRQFTDTKDESIHKKFKTPFPTATTEDFRKALGFAKMVKPDVLVLVLFGNDMVEAIRLATSMGMKETMQIVVPNMTLAMAEGGGPKVMEGVIGALPWDWSIPYKYNYTRGKSFVDKFAAKYNRYPSTSGASAYTILYEYKSAVERANSLETPAVVKALEGHEYTLLKDKQYWRGFDHQSVQTIYLVKCKPEVEVLKDKYKLDYFEILSSMPGEEAAVSMAEWKSERKAAGKSETLQ